MFQKNKKRFLCLLLSCVLISTCFLATGCLKRYRRYDTTIFSDNIPLSVEVYGANCYKEMKKFADKLNECINPNIPTSDVARFNAMNVGKISVDKSTYDLVSSAKYYNWATHGAFDVTLDSLSKVWKVDSENISLPHDDTTLPTILQLQDYSSTIDAITTFTENGEYYLEKTDPNAILDLGGIAKGYLADEMISIARANGATSAMVDVGGNIAFLGKKIQDDTEIEWNVGVNNCFEYGYLCGLKLDNKSVATSGTYERFYEKDGTKFCHIINPFTKMPVGVEWSGQEYVNIDDYVISCTIIDDSAQICDVMATAVCVLGKIEGVKRLNALGISGIIVTADEKYTVVGDVPFMEGDFPLNDMQKYE